MAAAPTKASDRVGHRFADPGLLAQALTHRSAGAPHNERLEFLGDALVNLFVAELIFECLPRADEGEMTRLRAALVNGSALAVILFVAVIPIVIYNIRQLRKESEVR